jgi:site-specific DNA-cytosine methylase
VPLYSDVHKLRTGDFEDLYGQVKPLAKAVMSIFGIECDSISKANNGWFKRLTCVQNDAERTGKSANACVELAVESGNAWMCGECVKTLMAVDPTTKKSCLDAITEDLNSNGFLVYGVELNSADYGAPQRRKRVYFCAVFVGTASRAIALQERAPAWFGDMTNALQAMQIGQSSLADYLFLENSPAVRRANEDETPSREKQQQQPEPKKKAKAKARTEKDEDTCAICSLMYDVIGVCVSCT